MFQHQRGTISPRTCCSLAAKTSSPSLTSSSPSAASRSQLNVVLRSIQNLWYLFNYSPKSSLKCRGHQLHKALLTYRATCPGTKHPAYKASGRSRIGMLVLKLPQNSYTPHGRFRKFGVPVLAIVLGSKIGSPDLWKLPSSFPCLESNSWLFSRQACVQLGKWDVALKLLGTMGRDGTELDCCQMGGGTQINQMPHKGAEAKRSNKTIRQGGFRLLVYLREFRIFRNIHAVQPGARFIVIDLGSFQSSRAHCSRNERQL